MKRNVELIASYWTLAGRSEPHTDKEYSSFDFKDRVEAAAKVGFKGIGIWDQDLDHVKKTRSLKEMKQILDDNGMKYVELEFLRDWFLEGERKQKSDIEKRKFFEAAEALKAHHLKVGDFYKEKYSMPRVIESFAKLCAEAAQHGTLIGFELMPFGMIDTLKDCMTMLIGAGAKNGGIIFDMWHVAKMGIPYEEVSRVPAKQIVAVEINDGTFTAPWSLHEDTINHRRFCGEGEFDIKGFLAALEKTGYSGPIGIEVLSKELRPLPLHDAVSKAFKTTMSQFA
ncbi:MAG TPA: sugar phosphate isomerase/epimerase [Candidatus Angelobacter sp.]|nr:sugar phosphate isomerase/epimerase [Candidatus Angelobacter sp.]